MTTQNTHYEHNDADASADAGVAEHSSAPTNEMTVDSTTSETSLPAAGEEGEPSSTSVPGVEEKAEAHSQAPASPEAEVSTAWPEVSAETHEAPAVESATIERAAEASEGPSALEAALEVAHTEQAASAEQTVEAPIAAATTDIPAQEEVASLSAPEAEQQTGEVQHIDQPREEQQNVLTELSTVLNEVLSTMEPMELIAELAAEPVAADDSTTFVDSVTAVEENRLQPLEATVAPVGEAPASPEASADAKAEEVRPFTDLIAEFRQAEAALRDSQVEALSILSSVAADLAYVEPQAGEITTAEEGQRSDVGEPTGKEDGLQVKIDETNVMSSSPEQSTQIETENPAEKPAPPARPVSPLLRPASRLRMPRHPVARHQREEAALENKAETQPAKVEPQAAKSGSTESSSEAPRPARRYRFDRPANGLNGSSPAPQAPAAVENQSSLLTNGASVQPRPEEVQTAMAEAVQTAPEAAVELQTSKPAIQETETPAVDHSRRRHITHKEQPAALSAALPAVEATVQETEPVAQLEEVAPEDLPPLEYSELQKASSRRRRRHRSGTSSVLPVSAVTNTPSPISIQPVAPVIPPAPPTVAPAPIAPTAPTAPAARNNAPVESSQSAYTIVSGYTVNQMNQGNELSGPFMGPDPSPARGSVMTRDGRTVRAETRTAQPSAPIYPPSRSVENGLSTAAMTQFANIVSQALQTQTDRMVAEFRRISQAPTNVSVTLPPFPSTERVGVFVDVANLLYSARTLRIGVDFGKLLDFLRGNRRLVRAHAYCPTSPQPGDEQMFLQAVKGLGYRITTKNYKTFSSGAKKADLDLDLCMDVVRLVDGGAVDCVVLVSGDSDFMPMLDYCSDHGVRVEVAAFDEAMSATLRQSCDLFINLSMLEEIRA